MFLMVDAGAQQPAAPYTNPSLPIDTRVDDLIGRMTLEEKVLQMQHEAPAIPRLDVPKYRWWNEALHGVARQGYVTVFPQAIGMAATWDAELLHSAGDAISTEARAGRNNAQQNLPDPSTWGLDFWAPNINIFRDPRWGRGQETYGEDPFLSGRLGVAYITGMQETDSKYLKLVATPKHFAVHSGPESKRHGFDAAVSPHDLEDTYLPAFRAAITEGHAESVMCAYNAIDGIPACANSKLLTKTLREDWGFKGYVVSDCGAVEDVNKGHAYAKDNAAAAAVSLRAGTDLNCGTEYKDLPGMVAAGAVSEADINTSLHRLMAARFRLGMFDPPADTPYTQIPVSEINSPEHRALALRAARESIVLLKNENHFLPLDSSLHTIEVVGANAAYVQALEGNYNGASKDPVRPLDGIQSVLGSASKIIYAQGSSLTDKTTVPVPRNALYVNPAGLKSGLQAQFFNNTDWSGQPVLTRIDKQIDYDWDNAKPAPEVSQNAFSVRWSGTIKVPAPGVYVFKLKSARRWVENDETAIYRLYIDGRRLIDGKNYEQPEVPYHFLDTSPHTIRVEYSHRSNALGGGMTLTWNPAEQVMRAEAVAKAKQSDVVVAFVGLSPLLEGEEFPLQIAGFSGGDRTDIVLPATQQRLLEALAATGKPLVVVLMNGSALAVGWAQQHAKAILEAWYPGEEGGTAIAETLVGRNNPSGRLPVTFYASVEQLPPFENYAMQGRTYRYFKGVPLYPFGFGLSYSTFAYSGLKLSTDHLTAGNTLIAEVDVSNRSGVTGDEVAELYLLPPSSSVNPLLTLQGFQRVHLSPGESRHLVFSLTPRQLSLVNENGERKDLAGTYGISIGSSQPSANSNVISAEFELVGSTDLPH